MRMIPLAITLLAVFGCGRQQVERAKPPALEPSAAPRAAGRVVMIIAQRDFRDEELTEPRAALEEAGYTVVVASSASGTAKGMLGLQVTVSTPIQEVKAADYQAIVFVGGTGAQEYWNDRVAHRLAQEAAAQGKVLGAICIAPVTLANAGVLKGKKATVWSSEAARLKAGGAEYTGASVEVDGRIITANGPEAAREFGKALVDALAAR